MAVGLVPSNLQVRRAPSTPSFYPLTFFLATFQVNWMVQRPAQARKERVADWWVSLGAKEPGYEFVDTKKTFDLNVDRIAFKGGNVVWISCE